MYRFYPVKFVANQFIILAKQNKLTNMQVQKLVYIAQGFSLGLFQEKLYPEDTYAWTFGPVVPELYESLRKYGNFKVEEPIFIDEKELVELKKYYLTDHDNISLIKNVYQKYAKYNGMQLSYLTHKKGTPWSIIWAKNAFGVIPADDIYKYYVKFIDAKN